MVFTAQAMVAMEPVLATEDSELLLAAMVASMLAMEPVLAMVLPAMAQATDPSMIPVFNTE